MNIAKKVTLFQIHGGTGRYAEPPTVWTLSNSLVKYVYCRLFRRHGNVFRQPFFRRW
jgi:hypothetical protein